MKVFILTLTVLLPFTLAYLIKEIELSLFYIFILIILFTILILTYLNKNNKHSQFSLKSFFFKTKNKN